MSVLVRHSSDHSTRSAATGSSVRGGPMSNNERTKAVGNWGERKAIDLLKAAGFFNVKDMNVETHNHPFGDLYAERGDERYLIGVKTRNKYQNQDGGPLNSTYNVRKRGVDVQSLGRRYNADLAWVAIAVIPELQTFSAYFGTIAEMEEAAVRFSIRMKPEETQHYELLGRENEFDPSIKPAWSNGGYRRRRDAA
jgi:hypothetical protein